LKQKTAGLFCILYRTRWLVRCRPIFQLTLFLGLCTPGPPTLAAVGLQALQVLLVLLVLQAQPALLELLVQLALLG
jgi:hypothetical protein